MMPSLSLDDFSLQLPLASHTLSVPRVPISSKRIPKPARPYTASSVEDKASFLPSLPNGSNTEAPTPGQSSNKSDFIANMGGVSETMLGSVHRLKNHQPVLGKYKHLFLLTKL